MVASGSILPFWALIASKIARMPSQPATAKKVGTELAPYSFFHAATKSTLVWRVAAGEY